ncbi:MAG: hypothetical protein RLZZ64_240, partial [Bacteroidota bacterium]
MKAYLVFFFTVIVCCAVAQSPSVMPLPAKYKTHGNDFRLSTSFQIEIKGNPDPRIYKEASRFMQRVAEKTGLFFKTWMVGSESNIKEKGLTIIVKEKGEIKLGVDESYALQIDKNQILLTANNDIGAIRGLETLMQLIQSDANGYFFKGMSIEDEPR